MTDKYYISYYSVQDSYRTEEQIKDWLSLVQGAHSGEFREIDVGSCEVTDGGEVDFTEFSAVRPLAQTV